MARSGASATAALTTLLRFAAGPESLAWPSARSSGLWWAISRVVSSAPHFLSVKCPHRQWNGVPDPDDWGAPASVSICPKRPWWPKETPWAMRWAKTHRDAIASARCVSLPEGGSGGEAIPPRWQIMAAPIMPVGGPPDQFLNLIFGSRGSPKNDHRWSRSVPL